MNESCRSTRSSSLNHKYGASIRPYADFSNRQTSRSFRFIAFMSSGTGSIAIVRFSWVLPCRKAALMSKDLRVHSKEAII